MKGGVVGNHKTNCTLDAPGYGAYKLLITQVTYGKNIVANQTEARRFGAFYPQVATSGEWSVTAEFPTWAMCNNFMTWIAGYYNRVTDSSRSPLLPMTVSVPSRQFRKMGYPALTAEFGDEFGKIVWTVPIPFVSASDPTITGNYASKFVPAVRDRVVSNSLAPSGTQSSAPFRTPYEPSYSTADLDTGGDGDLPVVVRK
jgi:hypothetical protein